MRNRTSLVLIELVLMLLVFSLASAFCLQAFVWADTRSAHNSACDAALLQVQNAAEVLRSCRGDLRSAAEIMGGSAEDRFWQISFDENWQQNSADPQYHLLAELQNTETQWLGRACITVYDAQDTALASLNISWQEVTSHG